MRSSIPCLNFGRSVEAGVEEEAEAEAEAGMDGGGRLGGGLGAPIISSEGLVEIIGMEVDKERGGEDWDEVEELRTEFRVELLGAE